MNPGHLRRQRRVLALWFSKHELLFHGVGICNDGAKAIVGKITGTSTYTKSKAANSTYSHCVLFTAMHLQRNTKLSFNNNALDEEVIMIDFMKP